MDDGYDYDELFPGRFLKSVEFKGRAVTLTIATVETEKLPERQKNKPRPGEKPKPVYKTKGIIGFKETDRTMVLNRTNGECFKAMFGRRTADWIGKRVTLYPAPYEDTTCIRVKGSPDLSTPSIEFSLELPQKRPQTVTLVNTQKGANANGDQ